MPMFQTLRTTLTCFSTSLSQSPLGLQLIRRGPDKQDQTFSVDADHVRLTRAI